MLPNGSDVRIEAEGLDRREVLQCYRVSSSESGDLGLKTYLGFQPQRADFNIAETSVKASQTVRRASAFKSKGGQPSNEPHPKHLHNKKWILAMAAIMRFRG